MNEIELAQRARELTDTIEELAFSCRGSATKLYEAVRDPRQSVTDPSSWPVIGRLLDYADTLATKTKELQNLLNP